MKLLKRNVHILLVLVSVLACEDEGATDKIAPIISSEVEYYTNIPAGGEFHIKFNLEDNESLGQLIIRVLPEVESGSAESLYDTTITQDLSGQTSVSIHKHFTIPAKSQPGKYKISLNYSDAAGNKGTEAIKKFDLVEAQEVPFIAITNYANDQVIVPTLKGDILLEGRVEDADGLRSVQVLVFKAHVMGAGARTSDNDRYYDQTWELEGATSFDLSAINPVINVSSAPAGSYKLRFILVDVNGYQRVLTRSVYIE